MPWTDEEVGQLRNFWEEGLTASQIAKQMGCTRSSVIGKAHRLDLPARKLAPKRHPVEKIARVIEMKRTLPEPSAPSPVPEEAVIPSSAVSIDGLEEHHCRFPYFNGNGWLYCGKPRADGSYCEYHAKKCYHFPPLRQ